MADTYETHSVEETLKAGEQFAHHMLRAGSVVCLSGDLGSGKTHFTKGIARALEIDPNEVHSPTFTLINEYYGRLPLYHFDCYRLKNEREFIEIGAEDYLYGEGISVIEWPEKVAKLLPKKAIWIFIVSEGNNSRKFKVEKQYIKPDI